MDCSRGGPIIRGLRWRFAYLRDGNTDIWPLVLALLQIGRLEDASNGRGNARMVKRPG
jgi:hypothetical protein